MSRTTAKARALHLGPETWPHGQTPRLMMRDLGAVNRVDGKTTWIGHVVHRDYDSGYPQPWEVARGGGTSWGFYLTEAEALAAAEEYARTYQAAVRNADGYLDLSTVRPPTPDLPVHRGITEPEVRLLDGERYAAADNVRRILDRTMGSEGALRSQLEQYADRLAGGPR